MTTTVLTSLRGQLMDESESLAGLLRKCLLLGAQTGSSSLRDWARNELNGYGAEVEVPSYRRVPVPVIKMNYVSGNNFATGQRISRFDLPAKAAERIPDYLRLGQSVEELESLAGTHQLTLQHDSLAYAKVVWNGQLESDFQQITDMSFEMSGSVIIGLLGKVRTQLIEVVADLTAGVPLTSLPGKAAVDAAVGQHIGTQYNTTIHAASGPTAIGNRAKTTTQGLTLEDALQLMGAVQSQAQVVEDSDQRNELLEALQELRAEADGDEPDTGEVVKRAGKLSSVAQRIGIEGVSAAVAGAVEAITGLALRGTFG
ncbi:hypothetical protein [Pseudoclavibacter sp. VKM Ac-2867]|uniref:AbiTii domain-containing protein n=1 Tax=Pseudoclavibacter sp. VKM Ac-2867 TaxID=2783829 RepID=UPI00188AEECA|nr:hypothetical protein [Pseudoclavibacter sp. VKM Ac-2867]MBF4459819.1 hypothetical protein [Pseudoclavibacter sp. VKM Ac-2867]